MGKIAGAFKLPCTVICITDKTQALSEDFPYPNNGLAQCELIRLRQPRECQIRKAKSFGVFRPGAFLCTTLSDIRFLYCLP